MGKGYQNRHVERASTENSPPSNVVFVRSVLSTRLREVDHALDVVLVEHLTQEALEQAEAESAIAALDAHERTPGSAYGKTSRALEVADLGWWVRHVKETYLGLPIFLMGYGAVSESYPWSVERPG